jgi:ribosome recycling factor
MDLDEILLDCEDHMDKAADYLRNELRGVRTGRASPAMVEYVKVDYYGSPTDLRQIAQVVVPEPTQLLVKPYDNTAIQDICKAIQSAGLGLNPQSDGKAIRIGVPPLSTERRQQLCTSVRKMGEDAKVAIRNVRRDANKHIDQAEKDKALHIAEDQAHDAKDQVQELTKKYEKQVEDAVDAKTKEIMEE